MAASSYNVNNHLMKREDIFLLSHDLNCPFKKMLFINGDKNEINNYKI